MPDPAGFHLPGVSGMGHCFLVQAPALTLLWRDQGCEGLWPLADGSRKQAKLLLLAQHKPYAGLVPCMTLEAMSIAKALLKLISLQTQRKTWEGHPQNCRDGFRATLVHAGGWVLLQVAVHGCSCCHRVQRTACDISDTGVTDPTATAEWHRDSHSRKQHGAAGLQ